MTLIIKNPADFQNYVGKTLGVGEWLAVHQKMIDDFADVSGDHQWIHVDVERAKKEMPEGKTITHGYLTLALLPRLGPLWRVETRSRAVNYGIDKLRFTGSVPSGSEIRLKQVLKKVEPIKDGQRVFLETTIEVKERERPAMVAEIIFQFYD
jgi:acyl dehydratase